jgi:D-alanine transaminase
MTEPSTTPTAGPTHDHPLGSLAASICYLDGAYLPLAQAKISVLDRGFIFGDGIYEVVPVYYRRPFRLDSHLARFERSTREIGLASPLTRAAWREIIDTLVEHSGAEHQFIYWQVTRGVARRDFAFPEDAVPTVFAMTTPFARPGAVQREQGLSAVSRADERWLRCDIKSVSLLGAVLARQYATEHGADEVVQFRDGRLTEGSASNMWVVHGGRLLAPPRSHYILEGIRYGFMEELAAAAGLPFEVREMTLEDVRGADELMLTAATREVLPIVRLDGAPVGTGRPGPIYAKLRAGYDAAIEALRSSA